MNQPTAQKLAEIASQFSPIAKEQVTAEFVGGSLYIFGSEIACLRLSIHYRHHPKARAEYSENLKTWFFTF